MQLREGRTAPDPARTQQVLGGAASAPGYRHQPVLCCASPWTDGHIWGGEGRISAVENLQLSYGLRLFLSFTTSQTSLGREILQPPRRGQPGAPERWPCCCPAQLCPPAVPPCTKGRTLSLTKSLNPRHSLEPLTVRFDLAPTCRIGTYFIFTGRSEESWCIVINKSALSGALRMAAKHFTLGTHTEAELKLVRKCKLLPIVNNFLMA